MNGNECERGLQWHDTKSVRARLVCLQDGKSDDMGESLRGHHRVCAGRAEMDGLGILEGRSASLRAAAASAITQSMRSRSRHSLGLGLEGGRDAVQDWEVHRGLAVLRVQRTCRSIADVGFGFGSQGGAVRVLSLTEFLLGRAMT